MKKKKLDYPNEVSETLPDSSFGLHFERLRSDGDHPEALTELYAQFTAEDFRAALLDPSLPAYYATVEGSRHRIEKLEKSKKVGAYLVNLEDEVANLEVIGVAVLGVPQDPAGSPTEGSVNVLTNIKRSIRPLNQPTRHLASWFDSERTGRYGLENTVVSSAVLAGSIAVAKAAGVRLLQTVVPLGSQEQGRLVVPENMLELPAYGFTLTGPDIVPVEGKDYPGDKYVKQLPE